MIDVVKGNWARAAQWAGGLAGLAAVIVGLTALPARAADLGGDCCADLEERVADLEATTVRKGNRRVTVQLYGQVNRAVLWWNDGRESNVYSVDNNASRTRVGLRGEARITPDLKAGFNIEWSIETATSARVDQFDDDNRIAVPGGGFTIQQAHWFLEHARYGRLTVGHASMATDGIAEIDLSGSSVVAGSAVDAWNQSFRIRDATTGFAPAQLFLVSRGPGLIAVRGNFMLQAFPGNMDGGRDDIVRWDSPAIMGFILSASAKSESVPPAQSFLGNHVGYVDWDVALRYSGEFNGFRFAAGVGFHHGAVLDTDTFKETFPSRFYVGSASILHEPSGLFLSVAAGLREYGTPNRDFATDHKYWYAKAGIFRNFFGIGKTSFYGEYYNSKDHFGPQWDSSMWGAGIVQHIDAAAMEIYVAYRHYNLPDTVTAIDPTFPLDAEGFRRQLIRTEDMDMVMAGARIRF